MTTIQVPMGNIAGIVFSLIVAWGLPTALCVVLYRKLKASLPAFFLGCATFFLFALVLEQLLHTLVIFKLGPVSEALKNNIWLYALYGGLAAGVFEETGRYLAMRFFLKKNLTKENALMYGAGHGGMEAILILGIPSINNLVSSILLNSGGFVSALAEDANAQQVMESLMPLGTLPAWQFFLGGAERIIAVALHLALSLLVYRAVKEPAKKGFFVLAILLHAAVDAMVVLIANHGSLIFAELVTLAGTVAIGLLAWKLVWQQEQEIEI
ncbi:MAG: YhfC family glutamic-type intramembrane protease [Lachnospiraceae bacterium]|nr:YhfC family glutamic-type intramembrane protease [Lachnospiraceae bacterium]